LIPLTANDIPLVRLSPSLAVNKLSYLVDFFDAKKQ